MQCLESIHTCKYFMLVVLKPALETLLDVRTYYTTYVLSASTLAAALSICMLKVR